MTADARLYKDPKQALGMPEDEKATNTTDSWSLISLNKGMLDALIGGIGSPTPDDQAFTVGTDLVTPVGGLYLAVRDVVDSGDAGALAMTARRALYVSLESPNGDSLVDDTNDALRVVQPTASLLNVTEASATAILTAIQATNTALLTLTGTVSSGRTAVSLATTDPVALALVDLQNSVDQAAIQHSGDLDTVRMSVQDLMAALRGITSTSRIVSAAGTTNATLAKASAGKIYAIQGYNAAASVRYLKIYDKPALPTVGSDTPVKTLSLPAGVGFAFDFPLGYLCGTGIAYALTTGSADTDTGALTSGDVVGLNVDFA